MRRISISAGWILLFAALAGLTVAAEGSKSGKEDAKEVRAVLELSQQFFYAGDPFPVRISIGNDGKETVANPVKTPVLRAFEVKPENGEPIRLSGKTAVPEPARPDKLAPGAFYGTIVDLSELYPALRAPGSFEIRWTAEGIESNALLVRVIPRYDAAKDYRAEVETDEGTFVIDFFKGSAPLAVKTFIDLANAGFYDGIIFHEVRPDWYIVGGDPLGDGSGQAPIRYPTELSAIPTVRGTVLMRPVSATPPANSSQFIVLLRAEPAWTSQATVLGQVVQGIETVEKISRLPSTQQASRPFYKPLKDVKIRRIKVVEKRTAETASES